MADTIRAPVIAVVDDDQRLIESLESLLESSGYAVRLFTSGLALLDSDCLPQIDCLISDIGMPEMDGFELLNMVQAARPRLPVILITGRSELLDHPQASQVGHSGIFQKPFNGQQLLVAVGNALRRSPPID